MWVKAIWFSVEHLDHPESWYDTLARLTVNDTVVNAHVSTNNYLFFGIQYELIRQHFQSKYQHCACKPGYPGRIVLVHNRPFCRGCQTYGSELGWEVLYMFRELEQWQNVDLEKLTAPMPT